MSLANGISAPQALSSLFRAQAQVNDIRARLKSLSASGSLTVSLANQDLDTLGNLQSVLALAPPEDFPEMGAFAQMFWGAAVDYAGDYATATKLIADTKATLDAFLIGAGIKLRTLSAVETETLRTELDAVKP